MATNSAGLRFVETGSSDIDRSGPLVTDPDGVPLQAVTTG